MPDERVTPMDPGPAAEALKAALKGHRGDVTVADAAARSGLALRDAEKGLYALLERYPGNLKATSEGELLFSFPNGLDKPRKELTRWHQFTQKTARVLKAGGRFVVRAWISVVMIGYALAFLAIVIGLIVASLSGNRDDRGGRGIEGGFHLGYVLFRVVAEALFWTFHPAWAFSPAMHPERVDPRRQKKKGDGVPFYQKVNRFVFGPEAPPEDPREREQRMLVEIRRKSGRIGVSDVMRVLGIPKEEAEPFLARLMLDYDGEVHVSEDGGITYSFPAVRRTAGESHAAARIAAILEEVRVPPLTGNPAGSNFLIALLNGFNLVMALFAMAVGLTVADVFRLFEGFMLQPDGVAWVLGVIPAVFSTAIFALPIWRAIRRPAEMRKVAFENGRRSLMRRVLDRLQTSGGQEAPLSEEELRKTWREAAGREPDEKELVRTVVEMGGDVDVTESGRAQYRFRDLEAEVAALEQERAAAGLHEQSVGDVVYSAEEVSPSQQRR